MRVLLIGSGGREHALAWKIKQSTLLSKLFIAPGNAGTLHEGENVPLDISDFVAIKSFCLDEKIEMVIVGPEVPLVNGLGDFFKQDAEIRDILFFGPNKLGAMLEGSKDLAKSFMLRHNIPTAAYQCFTKNTLAEGLSYLETLNPPYVLKADGLAAGKGVLIISHLDEAKKELTSMLCEDKFGKASEKVVIEEFLDGIELSAFVVTDGISYKLLPCAKDYKRIGNGDTGPNTGGMGSISPVPFVDNALMEKIEQRIVKPTIEGLKTDHIPYVGFIFFGLIKVGDDPFVIEYNVRLGDPETESIIPRISSDLLALMRDATLFQLNDSVIEINPNYAASVILVAEGYPGDYSTGMEISGLNHVNNSHIFHAGTKMDNTTVKCSGGRILSVTSLAPSLPEALEISYRNCEKITFSKKYYRNDIGKDLMPFIS